jgi:hypothetical protein
MEVHDLVPVAVLQASGEPRKEALARWSAAAETRLTHKVDMAAVTDNPSKAAVAHAGTG